MFNNKNRKEILDIFMGYNYIIKHYNKNDIIAFEGEPCEKIGIVLKGRIDIKRITSSTTSVLVSSLGIGSAFGEIITFSDKKVYPASVVSSTSSEVLFIDKDTFISFCTNHTDFLNMFLRDLSNKIILLNKSITTLSLSNIRQKISHFLLEEYKIQNSKFIKLDMTKQKLSEVLGVTRPSLSRELINMKEDGIIDYSKDYIKILNFEELENSLQ